MTWAPILAMSLVLVVVLGIFVQLVMHELRNRK
jgi:hypothetical protein